MMTWDEMKKADERLSLLEKDICCVKDDGESPWFCANRIWFEYFKPKLLNIVGFDRVRESREDFDDDWFYSPAAYDVAYQSLYNNLPDCRNCDCM